jgi:type IV secretion system protein VirD4
MTDLAIAALVLPAIALFFAWRFWRRYVSRGALNRDRTRALRWRSKMRLRPDEGYASFWELLWVWSRWDSIWHRYRSRTDMGFLRRIRSRTTRYAVRLGRAQYFKRVYSRQEEMIGVLAMQGSAKTATLSGWILDHDGPCVNSSCRADVYFATGRRRDLLGPVEVFNPQEISGVKSTFSFDILGGCADDMAAQRMADWLCGSTPGFGNIDWFESKGTVCLGGLLLAAHVGGFTMHEVFRWVHSGRPENCEAVRILKARGNREMVLLIERMLQTDRTAGSVRDTIDKTLQFMATPELAEAVSRGSQLDHLELIKKNGTLYLITSGDSRSKITPVVRALAHYIHYEAKMFASRQPRQRLERPLLLAFDEVAITCPVDLAGMLSDAAGWGIMIYWIAHSLSQLEGRYGKDDKLTIWANSSVKVLLPGNTNRETLEDASELCDRGHDGSEKFSVAPVGFIRQLPTWRALVIRGNRPPVVIKVRPYFRRLEYRWWNKGKWMLTPPDPDWTEAQLPEARTPVIADAIPEREPVTAGSASHPESNGHSPQPPTWVA